MIDSPASILVSVRRDGANGAGTTVAVAGELDVFTVPELRTALVALLDDPSATTVSIDLRDVTFLDSTALGMFVTLDRSLRDRGPGGGLRLLHPTRAAQKAFEVSGLARTLAIVDAAPRR